MAASRTRGVSHSATALARTNVSSSRRDRLNRLSAQERRANVVPESRFVHCARTGGMVTRPKNKTAGAKRPPPPGCDLGVALLLHARRVPDELATGEADLVDEGIGLAGGAGAALAVLAARVEGVG